MTASPYCGGRGLSALNVWKPLQNLGRVVFANLETVDTPDAHTAVFRFSKPMPIQLIRNANAVVTSVLPKHLYEGTDIPANPANHAPVGTGPFRFAEHKPGEYYRLVRNEGYWGEISRSSMRSSIASCRQGSGGLGTGSGRIQLAAFSQVPLVDLDRISQGAGLRW